MEHWEYTTLTLRISRAKSKAPGFFNRGHMTRQVDAESESAMNVLGRDGWELVSVTAVDFGTYGGEGDAYAAAFFKRPTQSA